MQQIEVDQSVKIEDTSADTVLASSDNKSFAILLPVEAKRKALRYLRGRGKSRQISVLLVFAAGPFLLLRDVAEGTTAITIDQEYEGRSNEAIIKGRLLQLLRGDGYWISKDTITFGRIGKQSGAHERAWNVHRGIVEADRQVRTAELLEVLKRK